jgi:hypothetical protein
MKLRIRDLWIVKAIIVNEGIVTKGDVILRHLTYHNCVMIKGSRQVKEVDPSSLVGSHRADEIETARDYWGRKKELATWMAEVKQPLRAKTDPDASENVGAGWAVSTPHRVFWSRWIETGGIWEGNRPLCSNSTISSTTTLTRCGPGSVGLVETLELFLASAGHYGPDTGEDGNKGMTMIATPSSQLTEDPLQASRAEVSKEAKREGCYGANRQQNLR